MFDIVTVVHNDTNKLLAIELIKSIHNWMSNNCEIFIEDNSVNNLGFAAACNNGAAKGDSDIIGFLNPDSIVVGDFMNPVIEVFNSNQNIMITGGNFNKNKIEITGWGLNDWVCGAAMFVRRKFWEEQGGFDTQFVWAYEETDLIRRCERDGYICKSLSPEELPILHSSPSVNSREDEEYKSYWMAESGARFWRKWNG